MAHRVGAKGQVVIAKEIRDELGIEPGWETIQRIVDGHVELSFLPPVSDESRMGSLARYTTVRLSDGELRAAREEAAAEVAREKAAIDSKRAASAD
jgi:AbrB family looped-hinge helix DNA binding protein